MKTQTVVKRIVVTGGAGFIGANLCTYLLQQGHKVICIDAFHSSLRESIDDLLSHKNFTLIHHDIIEPIHVRGTVDHIYNLATVASPRLYQQDPLHTFKSSVFGIFNMLELARKKRARILQASTSEIYGNPLEHPQRETYLGNVDPLGPRACYDEGKRGAETICADYFRHHKADVKIARFFNVYGPRMQPDDGRIVATFIMQALRGEPVTVFGDGSQTRSFVYIDDLIEGIIKMMNTKNFIGPVNIGNPEEITVKDLARKITKMTGSKSKIVYHPLPHGDPLLRKPDISLAKKKLNWEPRTPLDQGIMKTIEYYKIHV